MLIIGRGVVCALCVAASTFHPPALAAQIDSSSPAAVAAISTDSAPARSRDGRFVEVTKQQAEALREAASKEKLPTPPPGSDLEQMLSAGGGGSTDPRAHARWAAAGLGVMLRHSFAAMAAPSQCICQSQSETSLSQE